jgi:hypothetical protein
MIKAIVGGLLACTLFACGGTMDQTEATEPTLPEGAVPSQAVLIGQVEWGGETLTFYDATTAEDPTPAIIVSQLGQMHLGELSMVFDQQAQFQVTPAELWRAATGDGQVPDELLQQHLAQAADTGRPEEFQNFDPKSVDKLFASFNVMFPLDSGSTGTTTTSCWAHGGIKVAEMGTGTNRPDTSTCTGNGTFVRSLSVTSACDPILNLNKTLRAGMHNGNFSTDVAGQICWSTGTQAWQCFTPAIVPHFDGYYVNSFYKSGSSHRMGAGLSYPVTSPFSHGMELATADLASGSPVFGSTACP